MSTNVYPDRASRAETSTRSRRQARFATRQESRDRIVAAATELVRHHSYEELSIGAVMERAGFGRTIFIVTSTTSATC